MAHYFQNRAPRQKAALKTHVREPMPQPALHCAFHVADSRALRRVAPRSKSALSLGTACKEGSES